MIQHEFKKIKLQNQKQASKDKIKNASSLWIKCLRLCGLLRLQELYIFLLHFIQCFHGLPVFGPQVLEQGHIQLWQFGLKTESGLFCNLAKLECGHFWKPYSIALLKCFSYFVFGHSHAQLISWDFWKFVNWWNTHIALRASCSEVSLRLCQLLLQLGLDHLLLRNPEKQNWPCRKCVLKFRRRKRRLWRIWLLSLSRYTFLSTLCIHVCICICFWICIFLWL